jgi:carboxyl-terminal processing protease
MERWHKAAIAVLGVVVVGLVTFSVGFSLGSHGRGSEGSVPPDAGGGLDIIQEAYGEIRSSAVDPPDEKELARGAVRGMVGSLKRHDDPYALFYSPSGYESFQELTSGQFSGIGVWLKKKRGRLEVVSVLPETPALRAGLQRGDALLTIEGQAVDEMTVDEAVARIKGPSGTKVSLGVGREGIPLTFQITRRSIELPNLEVRVTPDELGYIRLLGFARGAGAQLRSEVADLTEQGVEGIVLDLRDNGGGLFSEGIDVASVFIEEGEIVTYKARSEPKRVYRADGAAFSNIPLVVLVNEGTASASEIVAGALQDRDRAILVGERTYGKGSVQEVFPLSDASALKLTTGAYFTPRGNDITGEGIDPDVEVDSSASAQRRRAVEILKGIVISLDGAHG